MREAREKLEAKKDGMVFKLLMQMAKKFRSSSETKWGMSCDG